MSLINQSGKMQKIEVKIFGFEDVQTGKLTERIKKMFARDYDLSIRYVEDIEEMVRRGIEGIPAISFNGELFFFSESHVPDLLELESWFFPVLYKKQKPIAMKHIIVPVDFSVASKNALHFAIEFAKAAGAEEIRLVHVYNSPMDISNPAVVITLEEQESIVKERLEKLIEETPVTGGIKLSYETRLGFAVEELVKLSKEDWPDLIIMGTMGEHLAIEKVFGTVSTDVSQQAVCPVLLVPPEVKFGKFEDILFASDYIALEGHVLDRMLAFAKSFKSAIHFVHVNNDPDHPSIGPEEVIFEKVFASKDPEIPMYFAEVRDQDVTEGLNKYIKNHNIDLLVIVTRKRTFWERLFHKSVTKRMVLNSEVPTLVLHVDDKPQTGEDDGA